MGAFCCLIIWIMTLAVCFFNFLYCVVQSILVSWTLNIAGLAFVFLFGLWNFVCIIRSLCPPDERRLKTNCWYSCSSVMVLLAISFTLITRYHYFEAWPRYTNEQKYSSYTLRLLIHKMGLLCLVSGIPVIYGCKCRNLLKDKKMIYKVMVDFIDIYEMAKLLELGAPSCTAFLLPSTYNNTINNSTINSSTINNSTINNYSTINSEQYNVTRFNCTESTFSALKEGSNLEITIQVFCSFSFLIFHMIYSEALKESNDEDIDSLKKYVKISTLIQDIPFFAIRVVVWILYGFENQFIFLVKNVVISSLFSLEVCHCYSPVVSDAESQTYPSSNREIERIPREMQSDVKEIQHNMRTCRKKQRNAKQPRSQTNRGFDGNH